MSDPHRQDQKCTYRGGQIGTRWPYVAPHRPFRSAGACPNVGQSRVGRRNWTSRSVDVVDARQRPALVRGEPTRDSRLGSRQRTLSLLAHAQTALPGATLATSGTTTPQLPDHLCMERRLSLGGGRPSQQRSVCGRSEPARRRPRCNRQRRCCGREPDLAQAVRSQQDGASDRRAKRAGLSSG